MIEQRTAVAAQENSEEAPAAIAVVGRGGSVRRATKAFRDRFGGSDGVLAPSPEEIDLVLDGQAGPLTAMLDGLEVEVRPVVDRDGHRSAVLTIPREPEDPAGTTSPLLDEPLDDSPAIVWLKDLEGRYLRVNQRYLEQLGTRADRVCGRTDAELGPADSIESPRLNALDSLEQEPLELEYMIAAFDGRPAYAVLRFALRDGGGQPTAVCNVAAPQRDASLARSECERLIRLDRWGRLDAFAIRQELLYDWDLTLADGSSGPPLDRDDRVAAVLLERNEALATAARLEEELLKEREEESGLREESQRAASRAQELDAALAAARARLAELEGSLERAQAHTAEMEDELSDLRAQLEEHVLRQEALQAADSAADNGGPRWTMSAQRKLSATLAGLTEWRSVLELAVRTLGSEGGWDAAVAWCPSDQRGSMRCCAMWTNDPAGLGSFETQTWQHRQDASTGEFGRARTRMAPTCLLELGSAEDSLLRAAAAEQMSSALLLPIRDGAETIAMVELLSRMTSAPNADLMVSLEAVALQLGAVARLLKLADVPHWRMGRP